MISRDISAAIAEDAGGLSEVVDPDRSVSIGGTPLNSSKNLTDVFAAQAQGAGTGSRDSFENSNNILSLPLGARENNASVIPMGGVTIVDTEKS